MPGIPPPKKGQRGPVARSDAHNLHERLAVQRKNVPHFTQTVSGCFRTVRSAEGYCRISSFLQTMAALGYGPLEAISIALQGNAVAYISKGD